ncbi:MAG: glycosyl hydrolase family 18 protein [Eubacteriales bacterium]|nr:glycosyl hydrolase family 18 protein [Eubacteriales bacterium]
MEIYVVQPNDNVDGIAAAFEVSVETVIYDNQLVYPYKLAVGQALYLPSGPETPAKVPLVSNGYAYPYISRWVLSQTLPYLSLLSVFSYGFTFEGELLFPALDDSWMIDMALDQGTSPILTLTPLGADGQFNNSLISSVVSNPEYTQTLIRQVLAAVLEKGYTGVDIDFEFILAEDRDLFTEFVRQMADALHSIGCTLSVALAPKTSADQPGLLYEGKDYPALGEIADYVLLMTYEWGYKYGPNMAVAPLNKVREVVEYAVSEIDPRKIHLGIPNYGYDWPLPFIRGVTVARTIGNVEAVQTAVRNHAVIHFDETAQSPYFRYTLDGTEHEVWFEDVRSLQAKFRLIKDYGLQGAGYWQLMRWWRANWLLLEDNFILVD